jgi:hypothetical protein
MIQIDPVLIHCEDFEQDPAEDSVAQTPEEDQREANGCQ